MKKKYKILLSLIALLLVATLSVGTGYGVWLSSKQVEETNIQKIDCFKVYYENDGIIEMSKIKPVIDSDGEQTSPYTITITNTCIEKKEVEIRLNTVETTTIDVNALVLKASGNISQDIILYKNLETTKTQEEGISKSKLIGKTFIEPNETIRTNLRMWFDERKAPNVTDKNNYFKGHIEIIGTDSTVKPTLQETLLADRAAIEKKGTPTFSEPSITEEGLYSIDGANGKYYYYRGVVNNNFVKFGNELWRIVGINSDGTIKLITEVPTSITIYSNNYKYSDYTGFTYSSNRESINNDIINYLDQWYNNNIDSKLDSYVMPAGFCNDTSTRKAGNQTYFGAYDRVLSDLSPIVTCPSTKEDFGGEYNRKVGLITADEVLLAGGLHDTENTSYYLANGSSFFTASPSQHQNNSAYMIIVGSNGSIGEGMTNSEQGIRPVINIVGSITYEGSGTRDNPYILDIE